MVTKINDYFNLGNKIEKMGKMRMGKWEWPALWYFFGIELYNLIGG